MIALWHMIWLRLSSEVCSSIRGSLSLLRCTNERCLDLFLQHSNVRKSPAPQGHGIQVGCTSTYSLGTGGCCVLGADVFLCRGSVCSIDQKNKEVHGLGSWLCTNCLCFTGWQHPIVTLSQITPTCISVLCPSHCPLPICLGTSSPHNQAHRSPAHSSKRCQVKIKLKSPGSSKRYAVDGERSTLGVAYNYSD